MTIKVLTPVAFIALFALSAAPALAQRRGDGGRSASRSRGSVSRGAPSRSYSGYRGEVRGYRPSYVRPYYSRPLFARPFYSFRPRVNLGFGIWMGYPVAYPDYSYGSPYGDVYPRDIYPAADPYAYGQAQPAPRVGVQRGGGQSAEGGVSFEITPGDAEVFVDGTFMGTAGEFDPRTEPLGLSAGRHRVEVRAPGYRTMTLDADVRAGEVVPFRGTLQRN